VRKQKRSEIKDFSLYHEKMTNGYEREEGGHAITVRVPLVMSLASNTTKSVSPAVQLLRNDRTYPSSSSASGAVTDGKGGEGDGRAGKRFQ
jgi:hypothetical protein